MARRRINGEGTIYHRKDGRYEGAVYLLTSSGARKRIHVYGQSWQEAHDKLVAAKMQGQQGIPIPDRTWKLGEYLDYWLEHAVQVKRRPMTYRRHEMVVRLYLKPGLGTCALNRMSVQTVQIFLDRLFADGQTVATIHQVRKVLSAALTYAMRCELLFRNVARLVELASYKPNEAQHWTSEEVLRFLRAARSDPLYPAFTLLILYGLRRGEVLGIRWCDVDFEQGVLHIRQQVQRINGALRQVALKTYASERDEPLLATAREVLRERHAVQVTARAAVGDRWQGVGTAEELVFTTRSGLPIESRNLYRSFLRICAEHGIRRITIHGLRHTNATTQKNLKVHDRDIQAILGHGDVRTTGIYEHVDIDSKRDALEKVEQQLFRRLTANDNRLSRQILPSIHFSADEFTSCNFGGPGGIRTHDTRLKRPACGNVEERLISIAIAMRSRTRVWVLGCVAVGFAVGSNPS
jgi:integrase